MFADHSTLFRAAFVITILLHGGAVGLISNYYDAKDIDGRTALGAAAWATFIALLVIGLLFIIDP